MKEEIARIEVSPNERDKFFNAAFMDRIGEKFRKIGFSYVILDVLGYRIGSMMGRQCVIYSKK